jgi:hypothetical protein
MGISRSLLQVIVHLEGRMIAVNPRSDLRAYASQDFNLSAFCERFARRGDTDEQYMWERYAFALRSAVRFAEQGKGSPPLRTAQLHEIGRVRK